MQHYYVKNGAGLYGVPDDSVERFAAHKAAPLVADGKLVAYDEKKHGEKPGSPLLLARAQDKRAKERAAAKAQVQAKAK